MDRKQEKYQAYINILKEELITATGCTEPIALAYGAAKCREVLGEIPDEVEVWASGSIIKNVKSVIVPNTGGMKGIRAAAAAGIIAGDASGELEVIASVSEEEKERIKEYLERTDIQVHALESDLTFDIVIEERKGSNHSRVRIANYHTNVVLVEHNGEKELEIPVEGESEEGLTDRSLLNMEDIWDFAMT